MTQKQIDTIDKRIKMQTKVARLRALSEAQTEFKKYKSTTQFKSRNSSLYEASVTSKNDQNNTKSTANILKVKYSQVRSYQMPSFINSQANNTTIPSHIGRYQTPTVYPASSSAAYNLLLPDLHTRTDSNSLFRNKVTAAHTKSRGSRQVTTNTSTSRLQAFTLT